MIITISGLAGSGKSSVAKLVAQKLGYPHYSAGDIQRQLAREHNLTITEWGKLEMDDEKYDKMVDSRFKKIAQQQKDAVIDAWLGAYFARHALNIFLTCDEQERARRRLHHKRQEEQFEKLEHTMRDMRQRTEYNRKRWLDFYEFDFLNMDNYDYVIDTTNLTIGQVADRIVSLVRQKGL
jgi:cytidylate kinase